MARTMLIVVDVQNDFCPGGALAVRGGDRVVPVVNGLQERFDVVCFTQDWHPADHCSFGDPPEGRDGSWPVHCVQDTEGAALHPDLVVPADALRVHKGDDPAREAYSGFDGTDLADRVRSLEVGAVTVVGLATDYCVRATALDAARAGLDVTVDLDACRGVAPETSREAVTAMEAAGITVVGARP